MSPSLNRLLVVLALLGGTSACGSGTNTNTPVPTSSPSPGPNLSVTAYDVGSNVNVLGITVGADRNIWFSECPGPSGTGAVAKITTSALLTVYPLPDGATDCPKWLTLGTDNAVWFTEQSSIQQSASPPRIGRIDVNGNIAEFALPAGDNDPAGLVNGADRNLWYDAMVPNGASTIAVVRGFSPITRKIVGSITLAPSVLLSSRNNTLQSNPGDGSVIVASGSVTRVNPGPSPSASQPLGIPAGRLCAFTAASSDGYLYLQCNTSLLARASQTTYVTAYIGEPKAIALSTGLTPVSFSGPMGYGSDGFLYVWGTLGASPALTLFSVSTAGIVQAFYVDPTSGDTPVDQVLGADGAMWFTVSGATKGVVLRAAPYSAITY